MYLKVAQNSQFSCHCNLGVRLQACGHIQLLKTSIDFSSSVWDDLSFSSNFYKLINN